VAQLLPIVNYLGLPELPHDEAELFLWHGQRMRQLQQQTAKAKPKSERKAHVKVEPRLRGTAQAAKYPNVSPWTMRRLAHDGLVPVIESKYSRFDVHDWMSTLRKRKEHLGQGSVFPRGKIVGKANSSADHGAAAVAGKPGNRTKDKCTVSRVLSHFFDSLLYCFPSGVGLSS
jgi:hypothetical protein